jgi:undecaprenyl-diphosphatase
MKNKKLCVVAIILGLVFVINTILVVCGLTTGFDNFIYSLVRNLECVFFDAYFVGVTRLGDVSVVIGIVLILCLIFRNRHSIMFIVLAANSALTNKLVKHIICRERPDVLKLVKQGGYSYPSGHSMIAMSIYGYLLYLAFTRIKNKTLKWICSIILSILILSIGISRVYVGVHYASDVLGGFAFALLELMLIVNYSEKHFRGN